jgi:ribosomal protein S18 acetylase RimI-like enzyme
MESARPATDADLPALGRLATEARAEMRNKRGGDVLHRLDRNREDPQSGIERRLEDSAGTVVVGCIDDTPVGFGTMTVRNAADGRPHAVVDALYVDPGARSVGVGEAMMGLLMASAAAAGAVGIEATALPGDRATKNFFETHGLVARALTVHRRLDP